MRVKVSVPAPSTGTESRSPDGVVTDASSTYRPAGSARRIGPPQCTGGGSGRPTTYRRVCWASGRNEAP